jgi:hypothetical protein
MVLICSGREYYYYDRSHLYGDECLSQHAYERLGMFPGLVVD